MSLHPSFPIPIQPLGEILVEEHCLSQAQLATVLAAQKETGERLGDILIARGMLSMLELHQAIATHYQLPFFLRDDTAPDTSLLDADNAADYLSHRALPWHKTANGKIVIATPEPSEALLQWAETRYGIEGFTLAITSPYDIYWTIHEELGAQLDAHSRLWLWEQMPHLSAREVLWPSQRRQLLLLFLASMAVMILWPGETAYVTLVLVNLFYLFTLLLKAILFYTGARAAKHYRISNEAAQALPEHDLPVYTILVPMYREEATLPRLIRALEAIDYPKSRLDIKLILEEDDTATYEAAKALKPHSMFHLLRVPYSLPKTKPKACNYALHYAKGDYVTIFDAEDKPDPLQLRKAVFLFRNAPADMICTQARLNYYNRNENLLTQLFAVEYAAWFNFMLPGLHSLDIPIPLGGTSNHFDLKKLRALGEWDPFNVTEDADLGIRLAAQGYSTGILDSTTFEEAPVQMGPWLRQRSRWIKGYMQTWLVHMRHPLRLYRSLSPAAFWGFQFFIGGPCLIFLTAPLFWGYSILWAMGGLFDTPLDIAPAWLPYAAFSNLVFGLGLHLLFAAEIMHRYRWEKMELTILTFPFYWLLHSVASFKALWQLIFKPHYWEKTPHGLTRLSEDEMAEATQEF